MVTLVVSHEVAPTVSPASVVVVSRFSVYDISLHNQCTLINWAVSNAIVLKGSIRIYKGGISIWKAIRTVRSLRASLAQGRFMAVVKLCRTVLDANAVSMRPQQEVTGRVGRTREWPM